MCACRSYIFGETAYAQAYGILENVSILQFCACYIPSSLFQWGLSEQSISVGAANSSSDKPKCDFSITTFISSEIESYEQ